MFPTPPFSVVPAVLQKIVADKAVGVCVLPDWPTRAWYPKALDMCIGKPVALQPQLNRLILPTLPKETHPLCKTLRLLVCLLSG